MNYFCISTAIFT